MTAVPHLVLGMVLEADGRTARGYSADHLPPKWFTKNPDMPLEDEVGDMISVIRHASEAALNAGPAPDPFTLWQELYEAQKAWGNGIGYAPLLWGLGNSLVERAMIEAFCRLRDTTFDQAVRSNAFGAAFRRVLPSVERPLAGRCTASCPHHVHPCAAYRGARRSPDKAGYTTG